MAGRYTPSVYGSSLEALAKADAGPKLLLLGDGNASQQSLVEVDHRGVAVGLRGTPAADERGSARSDAATVLNADADDEDIGAGESAQVGSTTATMMVKIVFECLVAA